MTKRRSQEKDNYTGVLVEGLRSDFKLVIEKLESFEENFNRKLDEGFQRQDERFDRIEAILKTHSQILQGHEIRLDHIENKLSH